MIFLSRKKVVSCKICNKSIKEGEYVITEQENGKGICFSCSPYKDLTFLPPGDAALTRRSKKYSKISSIVQQWNQRRRRYERKGQFVEIEALSIAKAECLEDKDLRAEKNRRAAIKREIDDKEYIEEFSKEIRNQYPNLPKNREVKIAEHACEKYSGRVGRSAAAKKFDKDMIERAVIAHIRHQETNYDDQFGKGRRKREIRQDIQPAIISILKKWSKSTSN